MDYTREQISLIALNRAANLNTSGNYEPKFVSTSAGDLYVLSMDKNGSYIIMKKTSGTDGSGTFDSFGYYYPQVSNYLSDWNNRTSLIYGLPK